VPEPPDADAERQLDLKRTLRQLWRNAPFRRLNLVLLFGYIAETFRITITLFFARDIIGFTNVGVLYAIYFAVGFVCVPLWSWLGNRIGKHRALAFAFAIVAVTTLAIFLLEKGQVTLFTILFLGKGVCFGALELLPASMIADTADVDSVMSRARRQGQLFAVSHMVVKFGQALGQFLSLNLLALAGYNASGASEPDALFWLRIFYCVGPPLVLAALVPALWTYPLTAARHRSFQKFVDARFTKGTQA
jgi:Na+/melibiose symporter-like transporter